MPIRPHISIVTLSVNGVNALTKRHRLAEWIQKGDPYICWDTYNLKLRGWKKLFHANRDQKKAGVALLISDKIDLNIRNTISDKEGHYMMIKRSIQEEDITIGNIYAPNTGSPHYIYKATANNLKRRNQQ